MSKEIQLNSLTQDKISRQFESVMKQSLDLARLRLLQLNPSQLRWSPTDSRWSIIECIEHLNLAGNIYLKALKKATLKSKNEKTLTRPYKPGFIGGRLASAMHPHNKKPVKMPQSFNPASAENIDTRETLKNFMLMQKEFIDFLKKSVENGDIHRSKIRNPIFKIFRMNFIDALMLNLFHTQRHLLQIEKLAKDTRFPKR